MRTKSYSEIPDRVQSLQDLFHAVLDRDPPLDEKNPSFQINRNSEQRAGRLAILSTEFLTNLSRILSLDVKMLVALSAMKQRAASLQSSVKISGMAITSNTEDFDILDLQKSATIKKLFEMFEEYFPWRERLEDIQGLEFTDAEYEAFNKFKAEANGLIHNGVVLPPSTANPLSREFKCYADAFLCDFKDEAEYICCAIENLVEIYDLVMEVGDSLSSSATEWGNYEGREQLLDMTVFLHGACSLLFEIADCISPNRKRIENFIAPQC